MISFEQSKTIDLTASEELVVWITEVNYLNVKIYFLNG